MCRNRPTVLPHGREYKEGIILQRYVSHGTEYIGLHREQMGAACLIVWKVVSSGPRKHTTILLTRPGHRTLNRTRWKQMVNLRRLPSATVPPSTVAASQGPCRLPLPPSVQHHFTLCRLIIILYQQYVLHQVRFREQYFLFVFTYFNLSNLSFCPLPR